MATDVNEDIELETDEQLEARARQMGWKDFDEYRGPPGKWTDARTFIARGEQELPILRDQNRRMSEKLVQVDGEMVRLRGEVDTLRNTSAEQAQAVKDAIALARRADQAGYNRALRELESERRVAVEAGDTVAFDQVQQQIDALVSTREEVVIEPPATPAAPASKPEAVLLDPAITAFVKANTWFNTDRALTQAMIDMHNAIIREAPLMPVADQLERALGRMKKIYPQLAGQEEEVVEEEMEELRPRARARADVLAPREPARPRQGAVVGAISSIADLTERAEAKRAFASLQRQDPGITEAEYMSLYDDPHADVLELRSKRK